MSKLIRLMKLGALSLLSLAVSSQAMAAFVLNGTRFIYEEGKKNTSFEVLNKSEDTYGGQVWVDNTNQGNDTAYLIPVPPFFKVTAKGKQIVRIMRTDSALPADRESLFWLNVQEIPPKYKGETEGGILAVAINTRVKLIYRPKSLINGRENAEKGMQIVRRDGETWLSNPTPYYFAVTSVKVNGNSVSLSEPVMDRLAQVAPKTDISLGNVALNGAVSVEAVNDWGGTADYPLN